MRKSLTENQLTEDERKIIDYLWNIQNNGIYDSDRFAQVLGFALDHEDRIILCRDILDNSG